MQKGEKEKVQTMLIPAKNHKGIELASSFLQYRSKPNSLSKSHPEWGGGGGSFCWEGFIHEFHPSVLHMNLMKAARE